MPSTSNLAALRQLLAALLPTDADFQAFCLDSFPRTASRFADGMDRLVKTNLLLQVEDVGAIIAATQRHDPQRFERFKHLLGGSEHASSNPYRGLAAFQLEEAVLFFGREALTEKLWHRFKELFERPDAARLLAIVGPSGSGKSSVARAGLLAELSRRPVPGSQALRSVVLKPGEHPLRTLALALQPAQSAALDIGSQRKLIEDLSQPNCSGAFDGLTLWAASSTCTGTAPLVVLVDQFEEVYTLCADKSERDAFVGLMLHAAYDRARQVFVVLTLRSDFLGETQRQHLTLNRLIVDQAVLVGGMTEDELRRAIVEPAAQSGYPLDSSSVELLLREAHGSDGALPLLQFALTQIWEGLRAGQPPGVTLNRLGGVGGALAGKAEEIFSSMTPLEQDTARRAFVRLVHLGEGIRDTRRRAPLRELCGRGQSEAEVLSILRRFATESARLITLAGDGLGDIAEVTHEALFENWKELRRWIDENRTDRRFHDRAAEAARLWEEAGRPAGRLWRAPDLDQLRDYQRRRPDEMLQLQVHFLAAAERQQRREKLLRWASVGAVLLAVLISGGVYIMKERQRAADAARAGEQIRQQLLSSYVERGRQLLFVENKPHEALLWLHRAQREGAKDLALLDVLRSAFERPEVAKRILGGHKGRIIGATFNPEGRRIITASGDKTARVWEADSGRLLAELNGHEDAVTSATFSPEGRRIVTTSLDHTARLWEADSGRLLAELKGHGSEVYSAAFSPDGRRIVTASGDKTARVWEADLGRLQAELSGHSGLVYGAMFSPEGRRIVTASEDRTARLWEADSGRLLAELKGHGSDVISATFSPEGRRIVTASGDKTARIWAADSGSLLAELKGHGGSILNATFSPDSRRIVTASLDKTARVWEADSGRLLSELKGHESEVYDATFSPDGRRIVTASLDKTARVWEADSGRLLSELNGHEGEIYDATFSPDGRRIVTASLDQTARVWEVDAGRLQIEFKGHKSIVHSATFSPEGRRIVTASGDHTARVWEVDSGRLLAELKDHGGIVHSAMFSPEGRRIVTASGDYTARVWAADSGRLLAHLKGHTGDTTSATFSPEGRRIVTASTDRTARVWAADSGRLLAELKGHGGPVHSATFSPDGHRIVTTSGDHTARVWEADSGRLLAELKGHAGSVHSAAFSPEGRRIVTASWDHTARVWEADSGRLLAEFKGHGGIVYSATFSPEGRRIVTASIDKTARVWEADSGRLRTELKGHEGLIHSAMFSPEGRRIVTASGDHTAKMWEADSGRLLAELKGHGGRVYSAMFSPEGRRIVTASLDHTARVWEAVPETRSTEEIAKLLRCYVPLRFEREGSDVLVPAQVDPVPCQQGAIAPTL